MKKTAGVLVMLIMLGLTIACQPSGAPVQAPTAEAPRVGELAPDFQLTDLNGQAVALSDFLGSPVLLNFWATWCGPCRSEMPYLQQIYDDWTARGLVLLAVDIGESASDVEDFMQDEGYTFPVALDEEQMVAMQYEIQGIPTTFFIDRYGIVQKIQVGAFPSEAAIEEELSLLFD